MSVISIMPLYASPSDLAHERGKKLFADYCSGCHALRYMPQQPQVSMPSTDAISWFGKIPPDLSLTARERGIQWLRAYLTGFYLDNSRPFGSNNHVIPDVAMPNVLAPIQEKNLYYAQVVDDIVSYLVYVAEPNQAIRYKIGLFVVGFLCLFAILWALFFVIEKNKLK